MSNYEIRSYKERQRQNEGRIRQQTTRFDETKRHSREVGKDEQGYTAAIRCKYRYTMRSTRKNEGEREIKLACVAYEREPNNEKEKMRELHAL
jgi:hypothetical protein